MTREESYFEQVLLHLTHPNPEVRRHSVFELLEWGVDAIEYIIALLDDESYEVRSAAGEVLGHLGDPRAIEPLAKLISDYDLDAAYNWRQMPKSYAIRALEQIGTPRALYYVSAAMTRRTVQIDRISHEIPSYEIPVEEQPAVEDDSHQKRRRWFGLFSAVYA